MDAIDPREVPDGSAAWGSLPCLVVTGPDQSQRPCTIPAAAKRSQPRGQPTKMNPKYLSEIERGWHAPSIVTAQRIAEALEVRLADLVRDLS